MFFRNTHKTNAKQIVSLKIVRQKKVGDLFETKEDKSITLKPEELDKLIEYMENATHSTSFPYFHAPRGGDACLSQ